MKKLFLIPVLLLTLVACEMPKGGETLPVITEDEDAKAEAMQEYTEHTPNLDLPMFDQTSLPAEGEEVVVLHTTKGDITIRLFNDITPTLAKNFYTLAEEGKYTNVPFHRVIKDFMIQSGDYENGNGTGGQSYTGKGLADEYSDKLNHINGAVACAKTGAPNSIGSQFYIVHNNADFLDGRYSVFGQVIDGLDIVNEIATVEVEINGTEMSSPIDPIEIKSAEIVSYSAK